MTRHRNYKLLMYTLYIKALQYSIKNNNTKITNKSRKKFTIKFFLFNKITKICKKCTKFTQQKFYNFTSSCVIR